MLILSIASISASDVSDINDISDNQYSNIINSYDSASSDYASGESESFDENSGSLGSSCSQDSSSDMDSSSGVSVAGSDSSVSSTDYNNSVNSLSAVSSVNSDVSNDDKNSVASISNSNSNNGSNSDSNSNSYKISSSKNNADSKVLNSSANGNKSSVNQSSVNKSSVNAKTSTKLVNSGKSVVNGKTYYLRLKDSNGKLLAGKTIKLTLSGRSYTKTTNSKGLVGLNIKGTVGKTYKLTYKFAGDSKYGSSSGSASIKIKMGTMVIGSGSSILKGNKYTVTLKNSKGNALAKRTIVFTINGKSYNKTTNSKGVASLRINLKSNKNYNLTYKFAGSSYYGISSKKVLLFVKTPTKLISSAKSIVSGKGYYITLKDSDGNALAGKTVKITYRGKTYKKTTNSKGIAGLKISSAPGYTYKISYKFSGNSKYGSSSGLAYFKVKKATNLTSSSSTNITRGTTYKVVLKDSNGNALSKKVIVFTLNGKNYTKTTNSNGVAGLTITASGGKTYNLSYKYGGSSYYGASSSGLIKLSVKNSSAVIKKGNTAQYKKGLNEIASLSASELKAYLSSSGYDSLNSAIKSLANRLVSGKTTNWAKAEAIFNYVRDNVSYSFYANSKKGASGTLSSKSANCCDQANLVVALCRAANIPSKFSHGQGCTFSSGLVTGHVWAQIYVDGVWYSADATSVRNSLGNIKNWNVNSFYSLKQYTHLSF